MFSGRALRGLDGCRQDRGDRTAPTGVPVAPAQWGGP